MATSNITRTPNDLHRRALRASPDTMARLLQTVLGQRLTAYVVGTDVKTIQRWIRSDAVQIRSVDVERRLRVAYEIALLLLQEDAESTVRAWFISTNEYLSDHSPAETIRRNQPGAALDAARSFAAGA